MDHSYGGIKAWKQHDTVFCATVSGYISILIHQLVDQRSLSGLPVLKQVLDLVSSLALFYGSYVLEDFLLQEMP